MFDVDLEIVKTCFKLEEIISMKNKLRNFVKHDVTSKVQFSIP